MAYYHTEVTLPNTVFDFTGIEKKYVGYDLLSKTLEDLTKSSSKNQSHNYPPYNLKKIDDVNYSIELALAGFTREDIEVHLDKNTLTIKTVSAENTENPSETTKVEYLHRGISSRPFERKFTLAEYVEVKNVSINNGILTVNLEYVLPESKKPRKLKIT